VIEAGLRDAGGFRRTGEREVVAAGIQHVNQKLLLGRTADLKNKGASQKKASGSNLVDRGLDAKCSLDRGTGRRTRKYAANQRGQKLSHFGKEAAV